MGLFNRRDDDDRFGTPEKESLFGNRLFKPVVQKEDIDDYDDDDDLEEEGVEDETGFMRWYSDDELDYAEEVERITKNMSYDELVHLCENHGIDVSPGDSVLVLCIRIAEDMNEYYEDWFKD